MRRLATVSLKMIWAPPDECEDIPDNGFDCLLSPNKPFNVIPFV